jgi:hypothetical protein
MGDGDGDGDDSSALADGCRGMLLLPAMTNVRRLALFLEIPSFCLHSAPPSEIRDAHQRVRPCTIRPALHNRDLERFRGRNACTACCGFACLEGSRQTDSSNSGALELYTPFTSSGSRRVMPAIKPAWCRASGTGECHTAITARSAAQPLLRGNVLVIPGSMTRRLQLQSPTLLLSFWCFSGHGCQAQAPSLLSSSYGWQK